MNPTAVPVARKTALMDCSPELFVPGEDDEHGDHGPEETSPGQQITKDDGRGDRDSHLDRGAVIGGEAGSVSEALTRLE